MTKKESIHLTVTDLAYKGQGIAHHQGKVFFIDDVVPGDQVLVENHHDHGSWAQAPERTMVQPSPLRQKSPCIYSSSCGGCQWLELPYPEQLRWKAAFIRDALQRVGKITYEQAIEVAGSPDQLHYRNRILLRGRINETGNISVGFFRKNSRDLIAVEQCMIADGELNKLIAHLQKLTIAAPPQKFRLAAQVVELAKRENKPCLLITLHPVEGAHKGLKKLVAALQAFPLTLWCGLQEELKHKLHLFPFEGPAEQPFYTAPEQFQQVNLRQNEAMRALVDQTVAELANCRTVVDLFCGTGNLSLGLVRPDRRILGVELNSQAIAIARYMVNKYRLPNAQYSDMRADKFLASLKGECDVLIADPPRAGMKECVPHIKRIKPRVIIYISCDPVTMARDIGQLKGDYEIASVQGFDFFPHTYHVETVAVLTAVHP